MKFLGAVLVKCRADLELLDLNLQNRLSSGQVLVKIISAGVCGKQIEEITFKMGSDKFIPHCLGHEGFGLVMECGPGVRYVKPNMTVAIHWMKGRGIESKTPFYKNGKRKINAGNITTFSEYSVISENRLTALDPQINKNIAPMFGCSTTTGIGVVVNEGNTRPEHTCAVIGLGSVGLNALYGCKVVNSNCIVGFENHQRARFFAKKIVKNIYKYPLQKHYDQFDRVFDTVGSKQSIEDAFRICKPGGKIFVVGVPEPNVSVSINALNLHKNKQLCGSFGGGIIPYLHIPAYYALHKKKIINLSQIAKNFYNLKNINNAITDIMERNVVGKSIITMT